MRWFQVFPVAVLVVACGGSSSRGPKSSPGAGGAAGESGAGTASVGVSGEASVGGSGEAGAGGAAGGADAQAAGAAGADVGAAGQSARSCVGLDCLAGAELLYVPDREWQRPAGTVGPTDELAEADYQPLVGPTWRAKFSSDALLLDMTPTAGGTTVHGTRDAKHTSQAWFELGLFAGGRFVVEASADELHAEYTTYGSGTPIVSSTRGVLTAP